MSNPLANPVVRYGMSLGSAAVIVVLAFFVFEAGTMRWALLGMALLEITVVPQILKRAAAQGGAA